HPVLRRTMLSLDTIARALGGEVVGNKEVHAPGPGHSAKDRSLTVIINDAGDDIIVHSFASDDDLQAKDYVRRAIGLPEWKPTRPANGHIRRHRVGRGREIAAYNYTDAAGALIYQVARYVPKDFRCRRPDGAGGWIDNMVGITRVPYHWPDFAA